MAMAENLDSRSNFNQAFLRRGQIKSASEQERCNRLTMCAAQPASWFKIHEDVGRLRNSHRLILNRNWSFVAFGRHRSSRCPFLSTSARIAGTNLRPWSSAKTKPNAPSATAKSWSRSSRSLPLERAVRQTPCLSALADPVAIHVAQARAPGRTKDTRLIIVGVQKDMLCHSCHPSSILTPVPPRDTL